MNQQTALKTLQRLSTALIPVIGFGSFGLGYCYGILPDGQLSDRTKQLFNFFSPTLALALVVGTCTRISTEIEAEVEAEREKNQKTAEEKLDRDLDTAHTRLSKDIEKLKEDIFSLDVPEKIREQLAQRLATIDSFDREFFRLVEACDRIDSWLEIKANRLDAVDYAVKKTREMHDVPQEHIHGFTNNMAVCVNWLQQSIQHLRPCSVVEVELHISTTHSGIIQQLEVAKEAEAATKVEELYQVGLSRIRERIIQETLCINAEPFLEGLQEHLLGELFTKSTQLVSHAI